MQKPLLMQERVMEAGKDDKGRRYKPIRENLNQDQKRLLVIIGIVGALLTLTYAIADVYLSASSDTPRSPIDDSSASICRDMIEEHLKNIQEQLRKEIQEQMRNR